MKLHNNQLQYVEFACTDFETTKEFYSKVFDWTFIDYETDGQLNYIDFTSEHASGGFFVGEVKQGSTTPIIYVTDLETAEAKVRDAGGIIINEIFSFPGGRRFHFTDPSGNELAVWSDK